MSNYKSPLFVDDIKFLGQVNVTMPTPSLLWHKARFVWRHCTHYYYY